MSLKTIVTFASFKWETGKQLLDVEVSLGSADKSSSCKVTIADPMHYIAAAVINHSQIAGGIQSLPDTNRAEDPAQTIRGAKPEPSYNREGVSLIPAFTLADVKPVNGGEGTKDSMASTGGVFTPEVKAFLDTVASRESNSGSTNFAQSYSSRNDLSNGGFMPLSELKKSRSLINGYGNYIGRYQMGKLGEGEAKARFKIPAMTFTPMEQDIMAYQKLIARGALKPLTAGDIRAALLKVSNEWAVIPGGSIHQPQPGATTEFFVEYYNKRLAFYSGGSVTTAAKVAPVVKPSPPSTTDTATPVIKGSVLTIQIADVFYEFMHQGTEMTEAGITILIGQGVRWVMSRRKRSATYKDITLKQLAAKVAKEYKVKVDYQATINPSYSHIDQSGISDYQMLLREVEANGLLMTEDKGNITIKERKQLQDSKLVLVRGINLISYKITDRAMGSGGDDISKLLPQSAKTTIDPISGKTQAVIADVDRNAESGKPTGKSKPATAGTLKSGEVTQIKERAATKRISGLPSTFVIPLTTETLKIEPISTAVTEGLPGVLDRLWVVKKVTHKVAEDTTTLDMVSPVEVVDNNPTPAIPGAKPEAASGSPVSIGFIYPVSGQVTSLQGMRNGKPHNGIDIGGDAREGSPIYAAAGGVCAVNAFEAGGAGNYCTIKHEGGLFTSYFHQRDRPLPAQGDVVKQGQVIGYVGNTGGSRGAHLHLEVLSSISPSRRLNVATYFPKLGAKMNSIIALTRAT